MERVKLPREVAEAIERIKSNPFHDDPEAIIRSHARDPYGWANEVEVLRNLKLDILIRAVYIGYEVEQTPEEAAIQWCIKTDSIARGKSAHDVVMVIKHILKGEKTNA